MVSCALCHIQNPRPASRVTPSNQHTWSVAANTLLIVNQRICQSHLDSNNSPTKRLKKVHYKGLDGLYWKTDNKKGRYNIQNKPISPPTHALYTTIVTTQKQLQQQQTLTTTLHTNQQNNSLSNTQVHQINTIIQQVPSFHPSTTPQQSKSNSVHNLSHPLLTPLQQARQDFVDEQYISIFFHIAKYKNYPKHIHTLLGIPDWKALVHLTSLVGESLPDLRLDITKEDIVAFVLLRLKRGLSHGAIAAFYNISESRTTELSNIALKLLAEKLIKHVRLLSKEEMLQHTPNSIQTLYPNAKIYICDDTYVYIQHSDDLDLQHNTFSNHKYRNLVKFFIGCAPDGYILTAEGPYYCDEDDTIFQTSLNIDVKNWLESKDVVVVDRGFREAPYQIPDGVIVLRPAYLHGEDQFTAVDRLESIKASQIRCVVENVNARLKFYRLLTNVYPNKAIPQLEYYVRVAAALLNLYYKPCRSANWVPPHNNVNPYHV